MRTIKEIFVHCSATPEGKHFDVHDIDKWHKARGWKGVGYHIVILLNGQEQRGRQDAAVGAHVEGYNAHSLGVCYIGGVSANNASVAKDTRTMAQEAALIARIRKWQKEYGISHSKVRGHNEVANKACPSFDVKTWWAAVVANNFEPVGHDPRTRIPPVSMPPPENSVLLLQNRLLSAGYDPKGLDGLWGTNTAAALTEWYADKSPGGIREVFNGSTKPSDDMLRRISVEIENIRLKDELEAERPKPIIPSPLPPVQTLPNPEPGPLQRFFSWLSRLFG